MNGRVRRVVACHVACGLGAVVLLAGCGGTSTTNDHKLLVAGATAITDTGCEACHMIGAEGNPGPGPSLTTIGRRLSAAQLDRALDDPRAPMPSFKFLAPHEFHAIVTYLASLKSRRDVIAVGGSPSFGPGPLRMSPELCGHQKVFYATILGRANAKKMTRQARAIVEQVDRQLARSLQQACRHSLSPHGAG